MAQKQEQRLRTIRQILDDEGQVRTSELARRLQTTPETIRHDLDLLERSNLVRRRHGWAVGVSNLMEMPFLIRGQENIAEKRRVSLRAMACISDGMTVFLDAGSTTLAGLPYLARVNDLTIVTTSLPLAYQAARMNRNVILCGGAVENVGLRTSGPQALDMIRPFNFDVAVFGTDGFAGAQGFTALDYSEVPVKQLALTQARTSIVVTDVAKFSRRAACTFCRFDQIDLLVTGPLDPQQREMVKDVRRVEEITDPHP